MLPDLGGAEDALTEAGAALLVFAKDPPGHVINAGDLGEQHEEEPWVIGRHCAEIDQVEALSHVGHHLKHLGLVAKPFLDLVGFDLGFNPGAELPILRVFKPRYKPLPDVLHRPSVVQGLLELIVNPPSDGRAWQPHIVGSDLGRSQRPAPIPLVSWPFRALGGWEQVTKGKHSSKGNLQIKSNVNPGDAPGVRLEPRGDEGGVQFGGLAGVEDARRHVQLHLTVEAVIFVVGTECSEIPALVRVGDFDRPRLPLPLVPEPPLVFDLAALAPPIIDQEISFVVGGANIRNGPDGQVIQLGMMAWDLGTTCRACMEARELDYGMLEQGDEGWFSFA